MEEIINSIENKIKELDNNKKILLFLGNGIESFFLALLLKKHFKNNLHCIFINTIYIDNKELPEIMYQYYNSGVKNICIDARNYFYKLYMIEDEDKIQTNVINKMNVIINNYKEYIRDEIEYFSFGLVQKNSFLKDKILIQNKKSFEPLIDKEIEDIIILFTQLEDVNDFFIKRKDYWEKLIIN